VTRTPIERAREMLVEHDMTRSLTEPLLWRVSPDVRDALLPVVRTADGTIIDRALATTFMGIETKYGDRMYGLPVVMDPSLPPNSLILEPFDAA
jgi:hypothetical protein